ncbi:MAG: peptidylprolyl isomerase [Solirubrobacterales bacterium]
MDDETLGQGPPTGRNEGGPNRTLIAGIIGGLAIAAVVVVVLIVGGGDDDGGGGDSTVASSDGPVEGCADVELPEPKDGNLDRPADLEAVGGTAVVDTSCGSFSIALDAERAPTTVASFENLVNEGFYDGTTFHRIVPDFVIQGGDPAGDGTGGPGYSVDEPPPDDLAYTQGIVAMAKTDAEPPGRSGSQFFVVLGADAGLPPDFALVGEVSSGFEVVERIASLGDPADPSGAPIAPVVINQIALEPS